MKIKVKKIDWKALAIEWLPMLIAIAILIVAEACYRFLYHGPVVDLRKPAMLVPAIAGIVQFAIKKDIHQPWGLVAGAALAAWAYLVP